MKKFNVKHHDVTPYVPFAKVKACAESLADISGMPLWKAMNIARWRAKRGCSLEIARVVE